MVQAHLNLINYYGRMDGSTGRRNTAPRPGLKPESCGLHYNYAILKSLQGDLAQAAEPSSAPLRSILLSGSHSKYGSLLMIQGQLAEAEREYRLALENDPNLRAAHFNLARILIQREKTGEAIDHLLKTLVPEMKIHPATSMPWGLPIPGPATWEKALRYLREARTLAASLG